MEYILGLTILALLIERFINNRSHATEREDLIRAFLSRSALEYTQSKPIEEKEEKAKEPDFTQLEDIDNEEFIKAIYGQESK